MSHPPIEILSQDLQASAEDEKDYDAPQEGNLLYKLYSLQDLLLMVRSSIPLTHTRRTDGNPNKVCTQSDTTEAKRGWEISSFVLIIFFSCYAYIGM